MKRSFIILPLLFLFLFSCQKEETDRGVILHFVTWKANVPEVWDEILKRFHQSNPHIKVITEIGPHSSTAFHDMLTQKLKNKSPDVDVFLMDVIWPPEFASAGWSMPLGKFFTSKDQAKFLPGPIMANKYKGDIYGIPLYIDSGMLYYRKDLLEKYGFKPPKTWQEMVEIARKIVDEEKRQGNEIYGFTGQFKQYEGLVCNMMEYILSNNGFIINPETGDVEIAKTPAIEAVRFVRDRIIGQIAPEGVLTYQEPESLDVFIQGKAVFHRNWPYAWKVSNDPLKSKISGKVAITRLPHFEGGKSFSTLGGWQVGVSAYTRHPREAIKFALFLSSPEVQKLFALKAGKAPSRIALYTDSDVLKANPQFSEMKDVFYRAYPRPKSPLYPAISNVLQRYFSTVLSDPDISIEKEAKKAEKEIRRLLALTETQSGKTSAKILTP